MVASQAPRRPRAGNMPQIAAAAADTARAGNVVAIADQRVAQLLAAAKATFMQKGFAATTMDDIAGAAGMSKKTLYKMYASKADLFRAMLLRSLPQMRFGEVKNKGSAIDQLRLAIRRIVDIAMSPDEIALHRLMVGERLLSPDIAGIFADVIFDLGAKDVVDALARVSLKPELRGLPVKFVSDMLLGVVFANDHFRAMVDDSFRFNRRALNKRLETGIAVFCEPDAV
jgi:TetR/AcrR family transcriptional repressor of mexJK operon